MALFGRGNKGADAKTGGTQPPPGNAGMHPIVGRVAWCRVCDRDQQLSRCWRRTARMTQCSGCGSPFDNPAALYQRFQPACPKCAEPLEQPGFDYGLCDGCGSKYEIVDGAKPGLLPNRQQRADMDKNGKSWSKF